MAEYYSKDYADLSRAGARIVQNMDIETRKRLSDSYNAKPWQSISDVPIEFRDSVALAMVKLRRER